MSKRKRGKTSDRNGAPANMPNLPPPLSNEEAAEIVDQFNKRGLPVILFVFNGPESTSATRIVNANYRQMAAAATELDEWSRIIFKQQLAAMQAQAPKVARAGILTPSDLK